MLRRHPQAGLPQVPRLGTLNGVCLSMHDLTGLDALDEDARDALRRERRGEQGGGSPDPVGALRRQAVLQEFCHRHRKRDLDAYRRALSDWRIRLWRAWLTRQVKKASRNEEEQVRNSGLLDETWYRLRYPQVTKGFNRHY